MCPGPSFLAKIKTLAELQAARAGGFVQYQNPDEYWVGLKYDAGAQKFQWQDGTTVVWSSHLDAIVNKGEQQVVDRTKRCYYLDTTNRLVAASCGNHKKYICQTGDTPDGESWVEEEGGVGRGSGECGSGLQ